MLLGKKKTQVKINYFYTVRHTKINSRVATLIKKIFESANFEFVLLATGRFFATFGRIVYHNKRIVLPE